MSDVHIRRIASGSSKEGWSELEVDQTKDLCPSMDVTKVLACEQPLPWCCRVSTLDLMDQRLLLTDRQSYFKDGELRGLHSVQMPSALYAIEPATESRRSSEVEGGRLVDIDVSEDCAKRGARGRKEGG